MANNIELITAPGKYAIDKSMEDMDRKLKEPTNYPPIENKKDNKGTNYSKIKYNNMKAK